MADQPSLTARLPARSMGLKLLLVCALALLMAIPALMVFGLLSDRTNRAETVANEIGQTVGGPQTFLGPVLAVPYSVAAEKTGEKPTRGTFIIFPVSADATVQSRTEIRQRSLDPAHVVPPELEVLDEIDCALPVCRRHALDLMAGAFGRDRHVVVECDEVENQQFDRCHRRIEDAGLLGFHGVHSANTHASTTGLTAGRDAQFTKFCLPEHCRSVNEPLPPIAIVPPRISHRTTIDERM